MTNGVIEIRGRRRADGSNLMDITVRENIDGKVVTKVYRGLERGDHNDVVKEVAEANQARRDARRNA